MSRIKRYTSEEIAGLFREEQVGPRDFTYLVAISTYAGAGINPRTGEVEVMGLKTVSTFVLHTHDYATGIYQQVGEPTVIILNDRRSVVDYDLISELHPMHDWDVYLWADEPWHKEYYDFGLHGEWYRRDVYPDGIEPFDGKQLGWADLSPIKEE